MRTVRFVAVDRLSCTVGFQHFQACLVNVVDFRTFGLRIAANIGINSGPPIACTNQSKHPLHPLFIQKIPIKSLTLRTFACNSIRHISKPVPRYPSFLLLRRPLLRLILAPLGILIIASSIFVPPRHLARLPRRPGTFSSACSEEEQSQNGKKESRLKTIIYSSPFSSAFTSSLTSSLNSGSVGVPLELGIFFVGGWGGGFAGRVATAGC